MSESINLIESSSANHSLELSKTAVISDRTQSTLGEGVPVGERSDHLAILFRDGLDMPIDGLTFIATYPSGFVCKAESTEVGAIALPIAEANKGVVKIAVLDARGKTQSVCAIDPAKCDGPVIIRSPKTQAKVPLQPYQQVAPARVGSVAVKGKSAEKTRQTEKAKNTSQKVDQSRGWWVGNGAWGNAWAWLSSRYIFSSSQISVSVARSPTMGLSSAGQPVAALIGPETDRKDNLRLGRNNVYRQPILDASKRLGLLPQALCALMDCEAGKVTETVPVLNADGTPTKDKNGSPITKRIRELWNANAGNAESGAAGLTQFLASTWLTHVLIPGYYIHEKSIANGWVRQVKDAKGTKRWMFVLADGTITSQPYSKRSSDANVKKCLAMRMEPAWAINAAADYGNANLKVLERSGFKLAGLNDMERAKLMYLMHHEGEGCGPLFVKNRLRDRKDGCGGVERLRQVFEMQLGKGGRVKVEEMVEKVDGDLEYAYRKWFATFVDQQFDMASKYFFMRPVEARSISKLMAAVGGEKL